MDDPTPTGRGDKALQNAIKPEMDRLKRAVTGGPAALRPARQGPTTEEVAELLTLSAKAPIGPWSVEGSEIGEGPNQRPIAFLTDANERFIAVDEDPEALESLSPVLEFAAVAVNFVRKHAPFLAPAEKAVGEERWEPIETAPKDGSDVLTWDGEYIRQARWKAEFDHTWSDAEQEPIPRGAWTDDTVSDWGMQELCEISPTHWQPLPDPPAAIRARSAGQGGENGQ